jgi:hypothetical protein
METVFRLKHKVFDVRYGWGEVTHLSYTTQYPIEVAFEKCKDYYTYEGYDHLNTLVPLLSFTEYTLQGFSQERPDVLPERGQIVWVRNNENSDWGCMQFMWKDKGVYRAALGNPFNDNNGSYYRFLTTINPYTNG